MTVAMFWALCAPVVTAIIFILGYRINKANGPTLQLPEFIMVQTGVLTALAILIALGGSFLPDNSSPIKWTLGGSLITAIVWLGGILYTMIHQQAKATVDHKVFPWIPGITNAAWISLVLLAVFSISAKVVPREVSKQMSTDAGDLPIIRNRIALKAPKSEARASWGVPELTTETGFAYKTPSGMIVLCFQSPNDSVKVIVETMEVSQDAIKRYCN